MGFEDAQREFQRRVQEEWLIEFCEARATDFRPEGFVTATLGRISGFDAHWFLQAVDGGLVSRAGGFFLFPQSSAKEQIFTSGTKGGDVRKTYLWTEPVITIGACARLVLEHGWPLDQIGAQSERPYAFDLVGKTPDGRHRLVGEVKGSGTGVDRLVALMERYCTGGQIGEEGLGQQERNAFRKVKALRHLRPGLFWALGPENHGAVFRVDHADDGPVVTLRRVESNALRHAATLPR